MVLIFAGLGVVAADWKFGLGTLVGLGVVAGMPFWEETMDTLAAVLVASAFAVLLAVPLGIFIAENRRASAMARPVLDLMQTLPAFVYLSRPSRSSASGSCPGCWPPWCSACHPGVRLTELGLRQVDREVIEAGEAFGASPWLILLRTKLPLATADHHAGRQPGDHVGAVDGGHRRHGRRRRPR